MTRYIQPEEVQFHAYCDPEDSPVRGNACATGSDTQDAEVENAILADLDRGNEWAWCCVRVVAWWRQFRGVAYLGCCSYRNEAQFRACPYFADLRMEALDNLNVEVRRARESLAILDSETDA